MGDCQSYGPFSGPCYNTGPNLGDPKRDHNFDNPPHDSTKFLHANSLLHPALELDQALFSFTV